ncbi:MAG: hypothetical protein EOO38_24295 [Cytophagaceae bacterium]|nr:MAG: hypothetical protein EOO38_24295 [Cytophagaceae bacterium]
MGNAARVADLHAFKAFAQKSEWGALPEAMLARFCDLDPFPGVAELPLVQETLQRQVIISKREIKYPAAYALRILNNRRNQKATDSAVTSKSLAPQTHHYSSHKVSMAVRESKMELYLEVADALGDDPWVASMTTGMIDELWNRGARSTLAILDAIAHADARGHMPQYGADWGRVLKYVDKAAPLARRPSVSHTEARD